MEEQNQFSIIEKFGSLKVRITGTKDQPLFNANDVILNVLEYNQYNHCKPWKKISKIPKYAIKQEGSQQELSSGSHKQQWYLTERGLIELLCRSEKEIAEHFKDWIYNLLKQWRNQELQMLKQQTVQNQLQLEQARQEIEELKKPRPASTYIMKNNKTGQVFYAGKDSSKTQNRPQQHFTERRKIVQNHQLVDIYMATLNEQDISYEVFQCNDYQVDEQEKDLIDEYQPLCNISFNNKQYFCKDCDPVKLFKSRGWFEKHQQLHSQSQQSHN